MTGDQGSLMEAVLCLALVPVFALVFVRIQRLPRKHPFRPEKLKMIAWNRWLFGFYLAFMTVEGLFHLALATGHTGGIIAWFAVLAATVIPMIATGIALLALAIKALWTRKSLTGT